MANPYRRALAYPFMLALGLTFGCTTQEEVNPTNLSQSSVSDAKADSEKPNLRLKSNQYIILSSSNSLPADLDRQMASVNGKVTSLLREAGVAVATSTDPDFARKAAKISGVGSVIRDVEVQWFDPAKEKVAGIEAAYGNPPASGDNDFYFDLQ